MIDPRLVEGIRKKYQLLSEALTERSRRRWAAVEARSLGWGGVSAVAKATGLAHTTIRRGIRELESDATLSEGRQRRQGAGRKKADQADPELRAALNRLIEPELRGDPQSPLRWTCKSTRILAKELKARKHFVGATTVRRLLKEAGYSLQANSKTREGKSYPDQDAQFRYISRRVRMQQRKGQPSIFVDTKKKETVGNLKNPGQWWRGKRKPVEVKTHDFPDPQKGKAVPDGVYDLGLNEAWESAGIGNDTAEFAVESIRRWWKRLGQSRYPEARRLLITADSEGSDRSRSRLWKVELQRLSNQVGLEIEVCHFPPVTSMWNKIEHRLFCHVTRTRQGRPLENYEIEINLIGSAKTQSGLKVHARLDPNKYEKAHKVTDAELATVNLRPAKLHGQWNYTILPSD